jgi:hypothetical protein
MTTVIAMTMMHEDMHQRAGQQQQVWQGTNGVRQVLCQQKIACNGSEDDQSDGVAGSPKTVRGLMFFMLMVHGDCFG